MSQPAAGVGEVPDAVSLREAYKVLSDARIDYNVRKWDTIRTGALFELGILAAVGGLLSRSSVPSAAGYIAAAVLVLTAAVLWWWVHFSVKREAGLQYSVEFSMYQVEKLLGLHCVLGPEQRWLPDHAHILSDKNLSFRWGTIDPEVPAVGPFTLDWWLEAKKSRHSFLRTIDVLFGSFLIAAMGFGTVLVLIGLRVVQ